LNSALCCFLFIPTSHAPLDRLTFSLSRCPKIRSRRTETGSAFFHSGRNEFLVAYRRRP
jgi:hypothetical protein